MSLKYFTRFLLVQELFSNDNSTVSVFKILVKILSLTHIENCLLQLFLMREYFIAMQLVSSKQCTKQILPPRLSFRVQIRCSQLQFAKYVVNSIFYSCLTITLVSNLVYDWNRYLVLGLIPIPKPKLADTFGVIP